MSAHGSKLPRTFRTRRWVRRGPQRPRRSSPYEARQADTICRWIGVDLSPVAATLVDSRLRDQFGVFAEIHHRSDVTRRTDLGKLPNYRTRAHTLFGRQEGQCGACRMAFPFRNFEVDHVIPRAKGGSDHVENLQLLCGACNRANRIGSQAELIAKLRDRGQRAA